jgi:hypothetical protein
LGGRILQEGGMTEGWWELETTSSEWKHLKCYYWPTETS